MTGFVFIPATVEQYRPPRRSRYMDVDERFFLGFTRGADDKCWPWDGARDDHGYGKLRAPFGITQAHRFSYLFYNGTIDLDLVVRHTCDNPPCVNWFHLIQGTHADNAADRVARNRSAIGDRNGSRLYPERRPRGDSWRGDPRRGEQNGRAKLTEGDVKAIRFLAEQGTPKTVIAKEFEVTDVLVGKIVRRELWSEL